MRSLISLGYRCDVAFQLRMHGDENIAHFFDWLAVPAEGLIEIIEKDFDVFDPDQLVLATDMAPHYVLDRKTGTAFFHQFPTFSGNVQPDFLLHYEPFVQKIRYLAKRFRHYLTEKPVTLVRRHITHAEALRLEAALAKAFPDADTRFLYLVHGEPFTTAKGHARQIAHDNTSLGDPETWEQILREEGLITSAFQRSTMEILGVKHDVHDFSVTDRFDENQLQICVAANQENEYFPIELAKYYRGAFRLDDAERAAEMALARNPNNPHGKFETAFIKWKSNKISAEQAAEIFIELGDVADFPLALVQAASALKDAGRIDEATVYSRKAIIASPLDPDGYFVRAICLLQQGQIEPAEHAIGTALTLGANHSIYHHIYAKILEEAGRLEEAVAAEHAALRIDDSFQSLVHLASLLAKMGQTKEAIEIYKKALPKAGPFADFVRTWIEELSGHSSGAFVEDRAVLKIYEPGASPMRNEPSFSKNRLCGAAWVFENTESNLIAGALRFGANGAIIGAGTQGWEWKLEDNVLRIYAAGDVALWEFYPFQESGGLLTLIGSSLSAVAAGGVSFLKEQEQETVAHKPEAAVIHPPEAATNITADMLVGKNWNFGEQNSHPWSASFQFLPNGKISGYENNHEKFWHLDDDQLQIFTGNGQLTWIFTLSENRPDKIELTGEYRLDSSYSGVGALSYVAEDIKNRLTSITYFENRRAFEAASKAEIAVLVLASAAPKTIDNMLEVFTDERFHFFLHVDAKLDLDDYGKEMKNAHKATFVQSRVKVFWGGFSMIEAELVLAEAAMEFSNIKNFVLISDDTAPLASPEKIHAALSSRADRITCVANGRPRHWYSDLFYPDSNFSSLRMIAADHRQFAPSDSIMIRRLEALREKGKKEIPALFFGRQWWALSRQSLVGILDYVKTDEHLVESFRFSLFPDETFFPTVFRICFPDAPILDIPTYADYGKNPHPWIFTTAEEILQTEFSESDLFIRKIALDKPQIILDLAARWKAAN